VSAEKRKVRPLVSRERWMAFAAGIPLGFFIGGRLPFFAGTVTELNEQGLLPAAIVYEVGFGLLGWFLFWAATYWMRRAAASPRAPRWLVEGMDPDPQLTFLASDADAPVPAKRSRRFRRL
jgi:cytochrome c biogenesis protein CcdA